MPRVANRKEMEETYVVGEIEEDVEDVAARVASVARLKRCRLRFHQAPQSQSVVAQRRTFVHVFVATGGRRITVLAFFALGRRIRVHAFLTAGRRTRVHAFPGFRFCQRRLRD